MFSFLILIKLKVWLKYFCYMAEDTAISKQNSPKTKKQNKLSFFLNSKSSCHILFSMDYKCVLPWLFCLSSARGGPQGLEHLSQIFYYWIISKIFHLCFHNHLNASKDNSPNILHSCWWTITFHYTLL